MPTLSGSGSTHTRHTAISIPPPPVSYAAPKTTTTVAAAAVSDHSTSATSTPIHPNTANNNSTNMRTPSPIRACTSTPHTPLTSLTSLTALDHSFDHSAAHIVVTPAEAEAIIRSMNTLTISESRGTVHNYYYYYLH